jgi:DNA-binding phage protein
MLAGVCSSCGAIGYRCNDERFEITWLDVWRAEQCADMIRHFAVIERADPRTMKCALRAYCAATTGGIAGVAKRAGLAKSAVWRWLEKQPARTSLEALLRIAQCEGFGLVAMLTGNLHPRGAAMDDACLAKRVVRKPINARLVRQMMQIATKDGASIPMLLEVLSVDRGTLARLSSDDYALLVARAANEREMALVDEQRKGVLRAEDTYVQLVQRGVTPSLRNASKLTGSDWWPDAWHTIALLELRVALEGAPLKVSLRAKWCRPQFYEEVALAIERVRRKVRASGASPLGS